MKTIIIRCENVAAFKKKKIIQNTNKQQSGKNCARVLRCMFVVVVGENSSGKYLIKTLSSTTCQTTGGKK